MPAKTRRPGSAIGLVAAVGESAARIGVQMTQARMSEDIDTFGYNLANGATIVVEATKSETATTDASASDILREVVKYVTPASPINF
jgi:hypothetical protein